MVEKEKPMCPTCAVQLDALGVSVGSMGEYDRLDDPALTGWDSYRCKNCGQDYQVNNQSGELKKLR